MKKLRILVVEDETILALDLAMCLSDLGHEVVATTVTGEEAIRRAEEAKPDLVLMDITLDTEMDGIQAAEIIYRSHKIPMIYVTAHSDKETRERAEMTNPLGYLIKPIRTQELKEALSLAEQSIDCSNGARALPNHE
jgi:CheY-like chemotaxis protein